MGKEDFTNSAPRGKATRADLEAEYEGKFKKYLEQNGRSKDPIDTDPILKEAGQEEEEDYTTWVMAQIPLGLRERSDIKDIFLKVALSEDLQGVWFYKICMLRASVKENLIKYFSDEMKRLEDTFNKTITAGININSKEIISSRDAKETINNIVKEIETNKNITENEAKVIYYNFERGKTEINPSSALVYLASKLLVKKLNEILDAIKSAYY